VNEPITARWHKDTRYYEIRIHPDLWGDWTLTRIWGRRGTKAGGMKCEPCKSYEDAIARFERLARIRARRGYQRISQTAPMA